MKNRKIIIISVLSVILIFASIVGFRFFTTLDSFGTFNYAIEHTQVGSENFELHSLNGYHYKFQVSADKDCKNELQIFENKDNSFFNLIGLRERYRIYMTVTSENEVGSLYLSLSNKYLSQANDEENTDKLILYYSNNNLKIKKCVYQVKTGESIVEHTESFQPNYSFLFAVPCETNNGDYKCELIKASFYDSNGNLVYEDIR